MNHETDANDTLFFGFLADPAFYSGIATGVAVAALAVLAWWLARRPPETISAFDNQNGRVTVSRKALQELIQGCCERVNEVGRARATVSTRGGVISTHVRLRLNANGKLDSISGYLQEQISEAVKQNLGIESIGHIDIVVIGILPETPGKENEGQSKL